MSLELTARLTLSSCVSQLTDFYTTDIMEKFLDNGIQAVTITLVDTDGVILPYVIQLEPLDLKPNSFTIQGLIFKVLRDDAIDGEQFLSIRFTGSINKGRMTTGSMFKCALHVCGDFIKFNEKGS